MLRIMEADAARLAQYVRERRHRLRLTQRQAAVTAELSNQTWVSIEKGDGNPNDRSLAGVDAAMRWEPGSARDVLGGGEPQPMPPDGLLSGDERLARMERQLDDLARDFAAEREANQREREQLFAELRRLRGQPEAPTDESAQRPA